MKQRKFIMSEVNNKKAKNWTNNELALWAFGGLAAGDNATDEEVTSETILRFELVEDGMEAVRSTVREAVMLATTPESAEMLEYVQPWMDAQDTSEADAPPEDAPIEDTPITEEESAPLDDVNLDDVTIGENELDVVIAGDDSPSIGYDVGAEGSEGLEGPDGTGADVTRPAVAVPLDAPVTEVNKKSPVESMVSDGIDEYLAMMKPGRSHSGNEGVVAQTKFFRLIQLVLRQEGSLFYKLFGELLTAVKENRKGAFSERYLFRYFEQITLPINDRKNFERMLNLLITTCEPSTRAHALKQVDLQGTMEGFKDHEMEQRVEGFYQGV